MFQKALSFSCRLTKTAMFCRVRLRYIQRSQLAFIKYMRLRISSLPIILVMIRRIYVFNRLLIIKTKVSIVVHYLGLGHEAMKCTVCLYVSNLAMIQIMVCCLVGAKPFSEPVLKYYWFNSKEQSSIKFQLKFKHFHSRKYMSKYPLQNGVHFVLASMC